MSDKTSTMSPSQVLQMLEAEFDVDFKTASSQEIQDQRKVIHTFISQRIIGQPAQETLPSLKAYIYAVKGAIMPSLLLTHDSVPQLLQLLSSIEHWRLALLKSVADAIIHDQYYTKTRAHADTLLPKEREHLDSLLGDSSMQRQAYISILGLLCQVHLHHIILSDTGFNPLDFLAHMNLYFPWINNTKSPLLHLQDGALTHQELDSLAGTGRGVVNTYIKLQNWARQQNPDSSRKVKLVRSKIPADIITPKSPEEMQSITIVINAYLSNVSHIYKALHNIFKA